MNNEDYIRKAVELADGWSMSSNYVNSPTGFQDHGECSQEIKDALAAQLVRQVDETGDIRVDIYRDATQVFYEGPTDEEMLDYSGGHGRTMNTIKAIVDSGVLDQSDQRE